MNILITGGNEGLGKALARHFKNNNHEVITISRSKINDKSHYVCDLTNIEEVKKIKEKIGKKYKKIDVLINNVGDYLFKDILELTPEEFSHIIDSNIKTVFNCSNIFLPIIKNSIINIGYSGSEKITFSRYRTPYNIAKTGVYIITKNLASALEKVRVNMISPGVIQNSVRKPKDSRVVFYEDIIRAIEFALENKSINGANIEVSKGYIPHSST